jgi:hypothetical protein
LYSSGGGKSEETMIRKTKDRVTHQMDGETGNGGPGTGGGKTTGSPVEAPG